jgi:hypothetical protein
MSFPNLYSQPKLFMDTENISKTDTIFPVEYEKIIKIYNKGNEKLVISSLAASCGCTSFVLSKDTILPQDSSELYIKINLATAEGDKLYHVYFSTNDTLSSKQALDINLFVYRDLISEPKKLPSFSNVALGSILTYELSLQNLSEKDIEIQNPVSDDNSKYEILSILPNEKIIPKHSKKEYKIKIQVNKKEFILSRMIIPTSSTSVPKLEYTVMISTK